uniref:4F5 domain-containing protein n=1 Tax=Meloidogyne hapla TaxID=6305 RepID=A0A1I8BHC7_MELHA
MARGHQKALSQQKNQSKQQQLKKSTINQKAAAAKALTYKCIVCMEMSSNSKKSRRAVSNSAHDSDNEDEGSSRSTMLDREDSERKNKEQFGHWECTGIYAFFYTSKFCQIQFARSRINRSDC